MANIGLKPMGYEYDIVGTSKVYKNVRLGKDVVIGDFSVIGQPWNGMSGDITTIIGDYSFIGNNVTIAAGVKTGNKFTAEDGSRIARNCIFGDLVAIGLNAVVLEEAKFEGMNRLHAQGFVSEYAEIGYGAWMGPQIALFNAPHPKCPKAKFCERDYAPRIGRFARIGGAARTIPGVIIGDYALIGSGSVVAKSVPEKSVVAGNPAKVIKLIGELNCWDKVKYGVEHPYDVQNLPKAPEDLQKRLAELGWTR